MTTIATVNAKGGVAKTVLALHLAVAATQGGRSVAVLDLDPQATAARWGARRKAPAPVVRAVAPSQLAADLQRCAAGGVLTAWLDTHRFLAVRQYVFSQRLAHRGGANPAARPGGGALPPRSTRTTAPRGAAAAPRSGPRSGPPAAPSSASSCTSAGSSPVAGASGSSTAKSASLPGWRRPFPGRPSSRAGCQHSRAASSSSVMCPRGDSAPPQACQELAVGGALLGPEAHHAYCAGAHGGPPLRRPHTGRIGGGQHHPAAVEWQRQSADDALHDARIVAQHHQGRPAVAGHAHQVVVPARFRQDAVVDRERRAPLPEHRLRQHFQLRLQPSQQRNRHRIRSVRRSRASPSPAPYTVASSDDDCLWTRSTLLRNASTASRPQLQPQTVECDV